MFPRSRPERMWSPYVIGGACGLAVLVFGIVLWFSVEGPQPDRKTYQAVFLANGQVYFGKLHNAPGRAMTLDDVFYLQVNQPLQQGSAAASSSGVASSTGAAPARFSLIKLGQAEIHGPQDRLYLMKSQLLFWENLRSDSQVVESIATYQAQGNQ